MRKHYELKSGRKPKNEAEGALWEELTGKGWLVTKRGWPDFFAMKAGRIALIEVKPHHGRRLKTEQRLIMRELSKRGIPCYQWTPDGGFVELKTANFT